jgi:chromosome segregation ATPase
MEEYTRAITELQHKLKQAAEHYAALEAKYDQDKARLEEDLTRHSTAIVAMKNELREANDLIQVLRNKGTGNCLG